MVTDQCRSCGADVVFVPSAKSSKPMILDAKSEKRIVLIHEPDGTVVTGGAQGFKTLAVVQDTYVDHHATCPKAAAWKGRTR